MANNSSQSTNVQKENKIQREDNSQLPLGRKNFIAMAVCGVLIVLGFVLMAGGSSTDTTYNPDIFSTRRIVVGPAITFLGFLGMVAAIIIKPKDIKE